ncbi:hypothetical protein U3653_22205 [Nocardia sp. CDC186]|uniref:Plasmid replication, integration and excision activator n=1 Tax=Nocardia implantans TaxID=3108168 RepID=A0ABU6AZP8_9NOCA|nr:MULTISPECIES: hypothetical protein [unclassified Nocardia]MBF6194162.1 hypothetical protein [Nocardia beijingensis]MEA3529770.1 hypothetical protein [Nocardia sp. CDC192]MEB3512752.1 hypothetical protein [Nocardia sp. CDC186]
MALKDVWFTPAFEDAFPMGLFLLGEIAPVTEFSSDRNAPKRQRLDLDAEGNGTGKRLWKGTVTDPAAANARQASFDIVFVADVQPVPAAPEIARGMRPVELEGLQVKPKIAGQGEFKSIGWTIRATGIKGDNSGAKSAAKAA